MALTPTQQQALKRQNSNLDSFEKKVFETEYKGIDAAKIKQAVLAPVQLTAFIAKADEFLKQLAAYASDIEKNGCPKTEATVSDWYKRHASFVKRLEDLKKQFSDKKASAEKQADVSSYKNYNADLQKIEGFAKAYVVNGNLVNLNVSSMKMLEDDLKTNAAFVNEVLKTYAVLIKMGSAEGAKIQKAHAAAVKAMQGYLAKREELIKEAQSKGPTLVKEASTRAQQALAKKQVAMFRQSENNLEQVQSYIDHLTTMDYGTAKEAAKSLQSSLVAARKELDTVKKGLKEELLAGTEAPKDVYAEKDKAEIADAVLKAWKKKYPKDDVLGVRFPNKTWVRDSIWRWSSAQVGWYNNDTSVLRLNVIVKADAKTATIYQAYVNKDNHSDSVNVGVDTKGSQYVVQEMLLKNWK